MKVAASYITMRAASLGYTPPALPKRANAAGGADRLPPPSPAQKRIRVALAGSAKTTRMSKERTNNSLLVRAGEGGLQQKGSERHWPASDRCGLDTVIILFSTPNTMPTPDGIDSHFQIRRPGRSGYRHPGNTHHAIAGCKIRLSRPPVIGPTDSFSSAPCFAGPALQLCESFSNGRARDLDSWCLGGKTPLG